MALIRKINEGAQIDETTGFGTISSMYGGRLTNKDGRPNVSRAGIAFFDGLSWYHILMEMPRWKFFGFILVCFLILNILFAFVYYLTGLSHLNGAIASNELEKFLESFFFSTQTFTTVGYGRISPTGYLTSAIAAFEAFTGLIFFAIATGLFFARFSRPKAFLKFSHNGVIAPYRDGIAFMFRLAPYKNNYLTDAVVKLTLAMMVEEEGKLINRFYPLELELQTVNSLTLSWTVVHPINGLSPFYNLTEEDLRNYKAEVMVFLKAFDETFSNTVVTRTSYILNEIIWGRKFVPMYYRSKRGNTTVLELDKLNEMVEADISFVYNRKETASAQSV